MCPVSPLEICLLHSYRLLNISISPHYSNTVPYPNSWCQQPSVSVLQESSLLVLTSHRSLLNLQSPGLPAALPTEKKEFGSWVLDKKSQFSVSDDAMPLKYFSHLLKYQSGCQIFPLRNFFFVAPLSISFITFQLLTAAPPSDIKGTRHKGPRLLIPCFRVPSPACNTW